jgi:hypothetical protein
MPPEPLHTQHTLPRNNIVEIITRGQEEILRQLRAEGIPETEALAVIRRFSTFSVQVLRELDDLYRQFSELLANDPERSAIHQEWLETKAGGLLLTTEAFIADLVALAIKRAKDDYIAESAKPRPVPTVPPPPSVWEQALHAVGRQLRDPIVYRSIGLTAWFLIWYFAIGSWIAGFVAISVISAAEYFFQKAGLLSILIAGGMFLLLLATGGVP